MKGLAMNWRAIGALARKDLQEVRGLLPASRRQHEARR